MDSVQPDIVDAVLLIVPESGKYGKLIVGLNRYGAGRQQLRLKLLILTMFVV
jgi:hypothetical protein